MTRGTGLGATLWRAMWRAGQALHRDDAKYPLTRQHDEVVINTMWAVDDFTEANGEPWSRHGSLRTLVPRLISRPQAWVSALRYACRHIPWRRFIKRGGCGAVPAALLPNARPPQLGAAARALIFLSAARRLTQVPPYCFRARTARRPRRKSVPHRHSSWERCYPMAWG